MKMIITKLELIDYIRVAITGIRRLVIMPDDMYTLQLILGTNGSGKSSVLSELWPLPARRADFGANGKKILEIQYQGRFYELISTFGGEQEKHEFIVDGQDLNDGGKISLFTELCREHFKVTNEIRSLALGYEKLTTMGPARRRYWLVKLSDTDYSYAISRYNKLKDHHRDAQGAIKRLNKRLTEESAKLVDEKVVKAMTESIEHGRTLINEVYKKRDATAVESHVAKQELEGIGQLIDKHCRDVDRLNLTALTDSGYEDDESLLKKRTDLQANIASVQQMVQFLFSSHEEVKRKYDRLIKAGSETITDLESRKQSLQALNKSFETSIVHTDLSVLRPANELLSALTTVYTDLNEKLSSLPDNRDGYFSTKKAQDYETKVGELNSQLSRLKNQIDRLKEDIDHRTNHVQHDTLECPQCKHSWTTKASEEDLEKARQRVIALEETYGDLMTSRKNMVDYLEEIQEYSTAHRSIVVLMRSVPTLDKIWSFVCRESMLKNNPSNVIDELYFLRGDMEKMVQIEINEKEITRIDEQIAIKKSLSAETIEEIETEMKKLQSKLEAQHSQFGFMQAELNEVNALINSSRQVATIREELVKSNEAMTEALKQYHHSSYQELLWEIILELQTQLARKEDALATSMNQQAVVAEIQYQLNEAIMNERIAKSAHMALSPTGGAIAEGLFRFTNNFVTKQNQVINSIWTYPLELLPVTMKDGQTEMDYKFPFLRNRSGRAAKDVVEGSESMKDMFDFAFRFRALQQLGLGHLPLFLDEVEAKFDVAHRERSIYFVKRLLEERTHGQIFMISHYESNHGALSSLAQTCVISSDNLMLSDDAEINKHVIIQ